MTTIFRLAGGLALLLLVWSIPMALLYTDLRLLGRRWSDPPGLTHGARDHLQLASSRRIILDGTLQLFCPAPGRLLLVLQARMPGPRELVTRGPADLRIRVHDDLLKLGATLVATGPVDTILTPALTPQHLRDLEEAFATGSGREVSIGIGAEAMVFMSGDADGTDIWRFGRQC